MFRALVFVALYVFLHSMCRVHGSHDSVQFCLLHISSMWWNFQLLFLLHIQLRFLSAFFRWFHSHFKFYTIFSFLCIALLLAFFYNHQVQLFIRTEIIFKLKKRNSPQEKYGKKRSQKRTWIYHQWTKFFARKKKGEKKMMRFETWLHVFPLLAQPRKKNIHVKMFMLFVYDI